MLKYLRQALVTTDALIALWILWNINRVFS